MGRHEQLIEQWFTERARPGEAFTGWGVLMEPPSPNHTPQGAARRELTDALGLDPNLRLLAGHTNLFGAVSTQRLVLGRQGGWRFTPKEELLSLDRSSFHLSWWDRRQLGPDWRHLVLRVTDGTWWDTTCLVHDRHNSDGFIRALGDNAVHLER
ncbi:MAG: hypothetical protein KF809_06230 [Chloroflexi bacterium]|nr:hypothetical protein [Chloroflexota bacterium]